MDSIVQVIGSFGFPIICGALLVYTISEQRENRRVLNELKEVIKINTDMITQFCELVGEVMHRA